MKLKVIQTGKTTQDFVKSGWAIYEKRIKALCSLELVTIEIPKKWATSEPSKQKAIESKLIEEQLKPGDFLIFLDEDGKQFSSRMFSSNLEKWAIQKNGTICILIGGAYGFDDDLMKKADIKMSLSAFTFSHQLVRVILGEQLYRALCIQKGHPYHHD
jgi:23S rRNA (pseudouridine1915-N3)-methyltransferase